MDSSQILSSSSEQHTRYVPPWTEPYIIGVAGNSGSGKTSVANKIIEELNTPWTVLISLDNFYKPLTPEQRALAFECQYDFDCPSATDLDLCYEKVLALKEGHAVEIPVYSFEGHCREEDQSIKIYGANVIIIEGIYALYHPKLVELMNLKIFVDTDLDVCLARRLTRDIVFRGRNLKGALRQWSLFVKPNADKFVIPTMSTADLVIPRGAENFIAIDMMIKHVSKQLSIKSRKHISDFYKISQSAQNENDFAELSKLGNLCILPSNNQIASMHTILLNKATTRDDFIFYFNRLATILINKALDFITYAPASEPVLCPRGHVYNDATVATQYVMAVNIIRSGDCFMTSLKRTYPDFKIGKLLVQSDRTTGEPHLHSIMLPHDLGGAKKFLLMDAQIISGAAVIMSIQVLVDHGILPQNIVVVCYLATEKGVRTILAAFPEVQIVVGKVGEANKDDSRWWFKTRFVDSSYFGT